jgi:hypothetical protein
MDSELFEFAKDNDLSFEEAGDPRSKASLATGHGFRILPTKKILIWTRL